MKAFLAFSTAVALAIGVCACGGGSGSGSASVSSTTSSATQSATASTQDTATTTTSSATASTSSSSSTASASSSGSASAASKGGGDESVQKYGHEATAAEEAAIASAVTRYYAAIAEGNGSAACAQLSNAFKQAMLREISRAGQLKGKGCVGLITLLLRKPTGAEAAQEKVVHVTGVRINGDKGFALIHTPTIPSGELFITREGGVWKVSTLIGSALPS